MTPTPEHAALVARLEDTSRKLTGITIGYGPVYNMADLTAMNQAVRDAIAALAGAAPVAGVDPCLIDRDPERGELCWESGIDREFWCGTCLRYGASRVSSAPSEPQPRPDPPGTLWTRFGSGEPQPADGIDVEALVDSIEKALKFAYSGSAETGSFIRGSANEYVPCAFMQIERLRAALRRLSPAALPGQAPTTDDGLIRHDQRAQGVCLEGCRACIITEQAAEIILLRTRTGGTPTPEQVQVLPSRQRRGVAWNRGYDAAIADVLRLFPAPGQAQQEPSAQTCETCRHWSLISGDAGKCGLCISGPSGAIGRTFCCVMRAPAPPVDVSPVAEDK